MREPTLAGDAPAAALLLLSLLAAGPSGAEAAVPERLDLPVGELVEGVACLADPSQTYTLYLPSAFRAEGRFPTLLVFDPRGRGTLAAELFRDAAESYGWIVLSSNDTRSDGPMEPNITAINALWAEVIDRYPADPRRIYAAGFSGGAMLAWMLGKWVPALAGVIGAGGRLEPSDREHRVGFAHFGAVGDTDFNYFEMRRIDELLEEWGSFHRLEVFSGPHGWMPRELAGEAVAWMEIQAMRGGLRPADSGMARDALARDLAAARRLEDAGSDLAAVRRYEAIARDFAGLIGADDLAAAGSRAAALRRSPEVKRALKEERRWDGFERNFWERANWTMSKLGAPGRPAASAEELITSLEIGKLQKRAAADGYEGTVARRILENLFTIYSFYRFRELYRAEDYRGAVVALSVAARIKPDRPRIWYDLACTHALSDRPDRALEALHEAIDHGFRDLEHLRSDGDLESVRDTPEFRRAVARLSGEAVTPVE